MNAWLSIASYLACVLGFAWLALAMDPHWQQVRAEPLPAPTTQRKLRVLGTLSVLASLVLSFLADHASMAMLMWVMTLTAAALTVAFVLSAKAQWFKPLVAWVRRSEPAPRD